MTLHCEEVVVIYMTPITAIPEVKETEDKPPSNNTLQHEIDKIDEMMNYIKQKYLDILLKNNNNDINEVNDKFEKLKNTLIKEFKKNNKYEKNDKYAEYKEINKQFNLVNFKILFENKEKTLLIRYIKYKNQIFNIFLFFKLIIFINKKIINF